MPSSRPGSGAWLAIIRPNVTATFMFCVLAGAGGCVDMTLR